MSDEICDYQPRDELFLWWLGQPSQPTLVGTINLARGGRSVSLRYAAAWVEFGFALSEDLPLIFGQEFVPDERDSAAGAVDDARPDRWGERVIRFVDRPPRLSLLEYLYFAGDDRFGALGISTSETSYAPRRLSALPSLGDLDAMHELVRKVLANEPVEPRFKRLIAPGVTMGGAKPKALIELGGEQWIVKFADGEPTDAPLVEHASMTLAQTAGIDVAQTRALRLTFGHAIALRRFDRSDGTRHHALSAHVALRAVGAEMGYPELAQLLRRRGVARGGRNVDQMHQLFRRMVFNILIDNTDDHEKNHALLVSDAIAYELSPAYDVLPSGQALGYQQMRVGADGASSTIENALSESDQFALAATDARLEVERVSQAVGRWKEHFSATGVTDGDIDLLREQVDRPFLRAQRLV